MKTFHILICFVFGFSLVCFFSLFPKKTNANWETFSPIIFQATPLQLATQKGAIWHTVMQITERNLSDVSLDAIHNLSVTNTPKGNIIVPIVPQANISQNINQNPYQATYTDPVSLNALIQGSSVPLVLQGNTTSPAVVNLSVANPRQSVTLAIPELEANGVFLINNLSQTVTNKIIDALDNTLQNIPNAALVNNAINLVAGDGILLSSTSVPLGGSVAISNSGLVSGVGSLNGQTGVLTIAVGGINALSTNATGITISAIEADTLASIANRGATTNTAVSLTNTTNTIVAGTLTATGGTIDGITIGGNSPSSGIFQTINGLTIANNGDNTLSIGSGKIVTFGNSVTINGTDGITLTLPSASDTLVGVSSSQSLTNKTIHAGLNSINGLTIANFSSDTLSQWTNNVGFVTSSSADILTNKTLVAASNIITGLTNNNLSGAANITNANLANPSITISSGTGLSGGGIVNLGGVLALTNTGVVSITGTTNQVVTSGTTGVVQLSLPQSIGTGSSPTFSALSLSNATQQLQFGGNGTLSWNPSATRLLTLPDATDVLIGKTTSDILLNKTIAASTNTISGLAVGNFLSANISQWTNNLGFITPSTVDILTNKTLTAPIINGAVTTTGLTLPAFVASGNITGSGSPTVSNFGSINGLTLTAASDGVTISGGASVRTLTLSGGDITLGNIIKPTSSGALTISSNGANTLTLDAGGAASVAIGSMNASTISLGANTTVATGKTLAVDVDKLTVGGTIVPQAILIPVPLTASLLTQPIFVADTTYQITGAKCFYSLAALLNGTFQVTVDSGSTAPGSGTSQLSSAINLSSTTNTAHTGTLIGSPTTINAGDRVTAKLGGTLTSLLGTCTIYMKRI